MNRKFLYLGILLFVAGIFVSLVSLQTTLSSQFTPTAMHMLLQSNSFKYVPLSLNQTGIIEILFNASAGIDFYLMNATAFASVSNANALNTSYRNIAVALEGKGAYEIYENSTNGVFPGLKYPGVASPTYLSNATQVLEVGTYYAFFSNTKNYSVTADLNTIVLPLSALQSSFSTAGIYGGISILLLLAGIILFVVSFFLKGKPKPAEGEMDEDVKREYERIEKGRKKEKK